MTKFIVELRVFIVERVEMGGGRFEAEGRGVKCCVGNIFCECTRIGATVSARTRETECEWIRVTSVVQIEHCL